ncbi:MAG: hypothetical protein JST66_06255 [Bacteroidetes bacterium]|nr:hypothetical protein [Bacteroidota bacterium]
MRFPRRHVRTTFIVSWVMVMAIGYHGHQEGLASLFPIRQYHPQGRISWPLTSLAAIALLLGIGSTLILLFGKTVPRQAAPPLGPEEDGADR